MAIFSELLDEFFQVRVAALEDQVAAGVRTRSVDGMRPGEQLKMIRSRVAELVARQDAIFLDQIVPALADAGVRPVGLVHPSMTTIAPTWSRSSPARSSRC